MEICWTIIQTSGKYLKMEKMMKYLKLEQMMQKEVQIKRIVKYLRLGLIMARMQQIRNPILKQLRHQEVQKQWSR